MSTPGHTATYVMAYILETENAYASGYNSSTEFQKATSTTAANWTAFNRPLDEIDIPYKEYDREGFQGAGMGADTVVDLIKGYKYKDSTMKFLPQSSVWIDRIIAGTAGTTPRSYYMKFTQPTKSFDAFGVILEEYTFNAKAGEYTYEELKWNYYEVDEGTAISEGKAFITTANVIFKDVEASIGGTAITLLEEVNLNIKITLAPNQMASGKYPRIKPVIESRKTTVKITFYEASDSLTKDTRTLADNLVTIIVDMDKLATSTSKTFQCTNMIQKEVNVEKTPKFGIYKYEVTYENGGTSVLSTS